MPVSNNFQESGSYVAISTEAAFLEAVTNPPAAAGELSIVDMLAEDPELPETVREREKKYAIGNGRRWHRIVEKGHGKAEGSLGTGLQQGIFANLAMGGYNADASYCEITMTSAVVGLTEASGLAVATAYDFGVDSVNYTITTDATNVTYGDVIPLMNAQLPDGYRFMLDTNGNLRCYKSGLTLLTLEAGTPGTDLYVTLTKYSAIDTGEVCASCVVGSTLESFNVHNHLENSAGTGKHLIRDIAGCLASKWGLSSELEAEITQSFDYLGAVASDGAEITKPAFNTTKVFTWSDVKAIVISNGTNSLEMKQVCDTWSFEVLNDVDNKKAQGNLYSNRHYVGGFDGNFKLNYEKSYDWDLTVLELFNALFGNASSYEFEVQIQVWQSATEFMTILFDKLYIETNPMTMVAIDGDTKGVPMGEASFQMGLTYPMIFFGSGITSAVNPLA